MFDSLINWLQNASWLEASAVFFAENLLILILVVLGGEWLVRRYQSRPVSETPDPITTGEIAVALGNVLLNTATTLAGWQLWRYKIIQFRTDVGWGAAADVLALLLIMDLLMYWLHRLAHTPILYRWIHGLHHRYERVRPITLFALNPVENLGFGLLWLAVVCVYPASWLGMSIYMVLNVVCGAIGHLGVEPVPVEWARQSVVSQIAGSSFHAQHHQDANHNFGFYTLLWDRLFGTLRVDYAQKYGRPPHELPAASEP
ncbi:MAG: sterol desaturase family protein [Planctomycetota bacterium]